MTGQIWLDEGYYTLTQKQQVNDCDYGKGVEYRIEHEDCGERKTLAITIYPAQNRVRRRTLLSVHDVTDEYNDGY